MIFTTKADTGEVIWYMKNNKVHSAEVISIKFVKNQRNDTANEEQKWFWTHFGDQGIEYRTTHGVFKEEEIFLSKEELLASL